MIRLTEIERDWGEITEYGNPIRGVFFLLEGDDEREQGRLEAILKEFHAALWDDPEPFCWWVREDRWECLKLAVRWENYGWYEEQGQLTLAFA